MKQLRQKLKKFTAVLVAAVMICPVLSGTAIEARASYVDTNKNTFVHDAEDMQIGYAGQDMQFKVRVGYNNVNGMYNPNTQEITDVIVRLSNDQNYLAKDQDPVNNEKNPYDSNNPDEVDQHDAWNEGRKAGMERAYQGNLTYPIDSGNYPFEVNASVFTQETRFDTMKVGEYQEVTFHVTIRNDVEEGYYGIPVSFYYNIPPMKYADYKTPMKVEFVNVYIKKAGDISQPSSAVADKHFAVGEGQSTPVGNAPGVMEFGVNFRNQSNTRLYDITVHLNTALAKDMEVQKTAQAKAGAVTGFPFDINEANYDRKFEMLESGATLTSLYSMGIMNNAASGYYPLSYTVSYKLTPQASISYTEEYSFYVKIENPSMNDSSSTLGEFNENDRKKARLIIDSYQTIPAEVYAGQEFELILTMKNASADINASNILFTLDSEKIENSAVFSMEDGANSVVVNSMKAGETAEVRMKMTAAPGVDPRSYAITIVEKYDSPEYKNAEEKVTLNIPVRQIARLSVSNFELMPESIETGSETNVMFGINNTGKVMLYNVEVSFEADSVKPISAYIGNIKPGETGNVDTMLSGIQPTMDDGSVKVLIRYEDVNGNPFSQEESFQLMVVEAVPPMDGMGDMGMMEESQDENKGGGKILLIGAGIVVLGGAAIWMQRHSKKKKEDQTDDEII